MKKSRTNFIFSLSIFLALFSCATLLFFFHIIKNKNEHTSNLAATLASKIAKKENATDLEKRIAEIQNTKDIIDSHFVSSAAIDSFIEYLERLGPITGAQIKVKGFNLSPNTSNRLMLDITANGTFTSIMRTIMLLENSPYQIHIINTYLSEMTQLVRTDVKGVSKTTEVTSWQAVISFSVLTSS